MLKYITENIYDPIFLIACKKYWFSLLHDIALLPFKTIRETIGKNSIPSSIEAVGCQRICDNAAPIYIFTDQSTPFVLLRTIIIRVCSGGSKDSNLPVGKAVKNITANAQHQNPWYYSKLFKRRRILEEEKDFFTTTSLD